MLTLTIATLAIEIVMLPNYNYNNSNISYKNSDVSHNDSNLNYKR